MSYKIIEGLKYETHRDNKILVLRMIETDTIRLISEHERLLQWEAG